jgi:DivIVA domain-containing protein
MALTAQDIQNASFSIDRKGYNVDEVDVFLEHVTDEIDAMNAQIAQLEADLEAARARSSQRPSKPIAAPKDDPAVLKARIEELEGALSEKTANDSAISQALIVAQRSADDIVANAKAEASAIVKDADIEADRIVSKAETDRQRIVEAIHRLEVDREEVRVEYRDMLNEFVTDAERKLAEIDTDSRRAAANSKARTDANRDSYSSFYGDPADDFGVDASKQAAPSPAATASSGFVEKDLSGFGDTEDEFDIDDLD